MLTLRSTLSVLAGSLLAAACGGGGGGAPFAPLTGGTDALFRGGASADYLSVELTLAEVKLVADDGASTVNLLDAPMQVEFVGLEEVSLLVASDQLPVGTYPSADIRFAQGSLEVKDKAGAAVFVVENGMTLATDFDQPVVVQDGGYLRFEVELDLVESLDGDLSAQPVHFDAVGSASVVPPPTTLALEEFQGLVVGASLADSELQVEAFSQGQPVGPVTVLIDDDTVLLDLFDVAFPDQASFFAAMKLGLTVVEVEGDLLGSGELDASRVEILDQAGGGPDAVEIEGLVLYIDSVANEMVLLIQDIVGGQELADSVLEGIGDPSSIDVDLAGAGFCDDLGNPVAPGALAVGQMVQVEFDSFVSPPFPAAKVAIDDLEVELTGIIEDVADLPDSFVLRVDDDEPGMGGQSVTIHLDDDSDLFLDIQFKPSILVEELVVGMKAAVKGTFDDDPLVVADDGIVASSVKVHHGHLIKADVDTIDEENSTFTTSQGKIVQTFGNLVAAGALTVEIAPGCLFKQDASSEAGFFALAAAGADLDIKIKGIGSPDSGVIRAYEIKAKDK